MGSSILKFVEEGSTKDVFRDKINLDAECSSPLRDQAKEWSKVGDIDLFLLVQKLYEVSQPVPCQNDFCCEPQNKNTSEAFPIIRSDLLDKLKKSEDYLVCQFLFLVCNIIKKRLSRTPRFQKVARLV